jgi:bacterioferritin (cytochrome b1)
MQTQTHTGLNRTGAQLSPLDVKAMEEIAEAAGETASEDTIIGLRSAAIAEAEALGSVPVPVTVKGIVTTGVQALKGNKPAVLIDKLGERLAFERTGTRLYEALIAKCVQQGREPDEALLGTLRRIQLQEQEHFELLARSLESLGADPTAQTPCADVAAVMSLGILQVVTDPRTTPSQCLNAMLVAELADNASWDLLIKLVRQAGQDEMAAKFEQARLQEQEHLQTIERLLEACVLGEAEGHPAV